MDATAVSLINSAYDLFKGEPDTRCRLSANFTVEEFDCHDGTKIESRDYEGLKALCEIYLEPLRSKFGTVTVNSGFRTPSYNESIGGASNSYHIYTYHNGNDQASDVMCVKGTPSDWHAFLNNIRQTKRGGNGGLGLYPTFVHVDMRDYPSSWKG
jgi:uncharacterized protein YcbK (DUF882 family)